MQTKHRMFYKKSTHTGNPFGFTEYLFGIESDERKTQVDFNAVASIKLLSHLTSKILYSLKYQNRMQKHRKTEGLLFSLFARILQQLIHVLNRYQEEIMSLLKVLSLVTQLQFLGQSPTDRRQPPLTMKG